MMEGRFGIHCFLLSTAIQEGGMLEKPAAHFAIFQSEVVPKTRLLPPVVLKGVSYWRSHSVMSIGPSGDSLVN